MKKKVREGLEPLNAVPLWLGMTAQQREEMENPWLHTQISDSVGLPSGLEAVTDLD